MNYVSYHPATGAIESVASLIEPPSGGGAGLFILATEEDVNLNEHYILNGEVTPKAAMTVTRTGNNFAGIPAGADVYVTGMGYEHLTMDGSGTLNLDLEVPGAYTLRIRHPAYIDEDIPWTAE